LRNWETRSIKKKGHTSIMDYARFNYVAQPEDGWLLYSLELRLWQMG
jgi:hypothetical protein